MSLDTGARRGIGNALDNVLFGNFGDNILEGRGGPDRLIGGDGNDILDGGTGADTMYGNDDDDQYWVDDFGDVVVENFNEGTDTVHSSVDFFLPANVENLISLGNARFAAGNGLANVIVGNAAVNIIDGGAGDDTLEGGGGDDLLDGKADVDTAVFSGIRGDYLIELVSLGLQVFDQRPGSPDGTDTLYNIEKLTFADTNISVIVGTDFTDDHLTGSDGEDEIFGGAGKDVLEGRGGNDVLYGAGGDDTLNGGPGLDWAIYTDHAPIGATFSAVKVDLTEGRSYQGVGGILGFSWVPEDTLSGVEKSLKARLTGTSLSETVKTIISKDSTATTY